MKSSPSEQRWDGSYRGLQWKTSVFQNRGECLGVTRVFPSHQTVFWGGLEGKNLLCEELDFGAEQEPEPIPSDAVWVDSTWKCKAVGKRDGSSNRSLKWDFPAYKWKPGTAANGSQESRLRKAIALAQPLWSETNKLYNDTRGTVNVVLLLGNV